jgi:hypothetical protein
VGDELEVDVPGHEHPDIEANIEELATAVMGPQKSEFAGGGRYSEDGLAFKVDQLLNQGIKVKLPWQLWTAIVGALGGLGVQLIATFGNIPD